MPPDIFEVLYTNLINDKHLRVCPVSIHGFDAIEAQKRIGKSFSNRPKGDYGIVEAGILK